MRIKNADNFKLGWLKQYLFNHKGYIAGGCFKDIFFGRTVHDLDIFFETPEHFAEALLVFNARERCQPAYENENVVAFKFENNIVCELNRKRFGVPDIVIGDFDYTIAKFAMYESQGEYHVCYHDDYFEHLHQRRLVIDDKLLYPSLERMLKYVRNGYNPCRETKIKFLNAIKQLPLEQVSASLYEGID